MIFPPEPSIECVKVSHVIFECRVINHHPLYTSLTQGAESDPLRGICTRNVINSGVYFRQQST